jgi:electron transport complex protein RnfG
MKGFKDVIVLVLIAVFAGIALSSVYLGTKEKIAEVKRQELKSALQKVMPFLKDSYKEEKFNCCNETVTIYKVEENNKLQGVAMQLTTSQGFSGNITFLLGVGVDGKVTGLYILEHKETPGLGTKAANKKWWGQFVDKSLKNFNFKVKKDGGDVDAITAATITSRAVSGGIEKGLKIFEKYKKERCNE